MAIITISRGTKSGGLKLAEQLSERLGYTAMSREFVMEGARKYNIMEDELLRRLDETPTFWEKLTREHRRYLCFIQCSLIDAVKKDNVVYHGYSGQLFLKGIRHVLKIRLEAPQAERIEAIMLEQKLDFEAAREYIERIDEQRARWVRSLYQEDIRDLALYDMAFNTGNLSIDSIVEIVAMTVKRPEFKTTEQSLARLEDLSLSCEVRAAIASDDKLWSIPLKVSSQQGVVALQGMVKDDKVRDGLFEIAKQVKGVKDCQLNIGLASDPLKRGFHGQN